MTQGRCERLSKKGIFIFIATGRNAEEIREMLPEGFEVGAIITANGMAGYIGEEVVYEHSLLRELVETIIEKARGNEVYYELIPYDESRMVLQQNKEYVINEIREPKPESVEINEWISRQKLLKKKLSEQKK